MEKGLGWFQGKNFPDDKQVGLRPLEGPGKRAADHTENLLSPTSLQEPEEPIQKKTQCGSGTTDQASYGILCQCVFPS